MSFRYYYTKNEANFGKPVRTSVKGGTHISFEIFLKFGKKFVALRWKNGIPKHPSPGNKLYWCHDLIRFGETVEQCVARIVQAQAGAKIKSARTFYIETWVDENKHWHIVPHILAELKTKPKPHHGVTEVIYFTSKNVPNDFGWWKKKDVISYIKKFRL